MLKADPLTSLVPLVNDAKEEKEMQEAEFADGAIDPVVETLSAVCCSSNPIFCSGDQTKLYKSLVKVGRGYVKCFLLLSSSEDLVFRAISVKTNEAIAIKQMNLEEWILTQSFINEFLFNRKSRHKNIVQVLDSFLCEGFKWS